MQKLRVWNNLVEQPCSSLEWSFGAILGKTISEILEVEREGGDGNRGAVAVEVEVA